MTLYKRCWNGPPLQSNITEPFYTKNPWFTEIYQECCMLSSQPHPQHSTTCPMCYTIALQMASHLDVGKNVIGCLWRPQNWSVSSCPLSWLGHEKNGQEVYSFHSFIEIYLSESVFADVRSCCTAFFCPCMGILCVIYTAHIDISVILLHAC
jgi:hypothetical protein